MPVPTHLTHGPLKEKGIQQYRRLPLIARVTQNTGQTTYWRSENVSEGGIFVRAAPPLPMGTELLIGFYVPTSEIEIQSRVRVVWVNDPNRADYESSQPYGMGMEFVELRDDYRGLIREYIEGANPGGDLAH